MTTYIVLRVGAAASRLLPLSVLYTLATLCARVASLLPSSARHSVRANIARAMGCRAGSAAVRRASAKAFRCQALNYVDLMRMDRVTARDLDETLVRGDLRHFLDAMALGRGAIILSGHVGNADYVGQWLGVHGYAVHTAMECLRPPQLHVLVARQRGAGLVVHPAEPRTLGILTDALRGGGVVALLADRDTTGTGYAVELFGVPTRLPVGPALLGLRTGAPIVPAFGHRLRDNRLFVYVDPAVQLHRSRDLRRDLPEAMRVIAGLLETGIARAPDQWTAFDPVWPDLAKEGAA